MVYLLEHRWQGAVMASTLAEHVIQSAAAISALPQERPGMMALAPARRVALAIAQDLVQTGRVSADGYAHRWSEVEIVSEGEVAALSPAATTIATLPLILFCHEIPAQLDHVLQATLPSPHFSPALQDSTRLMARAIAALLGATPLAALLPDLLQTRHASSTSPLFPVLEQTQILRHRRASLHTAIAELTHDYPSDIASVGLAFYCLLSTPNELGLAMRRAARCPEALHVVTLTGVLAGAHHTQWSIPLPWQLSQSAQPDRAEAMSQWRAVIQRLFATWAGVMSVEAPWSAAIAASQSPFRR
jgi:hypothetical protein